MRASLEQGIPQGSILSTLLCNLYYGHIERNVLEWQVKRKQPLPEEEAEGLDAAAISSRHASLLIRLTDDYLLLTTRPHLAHWFARTMAAGMPRWGCEINPNKSRVNFHAPMPAPAGGDSPAGPAVLPRFDDAATNGATIPALSVVSLTTRSPSLAAHAPWLPWCGFLLHPETLELRSSYDRCVPLAWVSRRETAPRRRSSLTPYPYPPREAASSSGTFAPRSRSARRASTGSGCCGG